MNNIIILLSALVALSAADIARFRKCPGVNRDNCNVDEVRITPCRATARGKDKCNVQHGENANLSFDFTPNFSTSNLLTAVYWANGLKDEPFDQLERSPACSFTTCPTESGKQQRFDYSIAINKNMPPGTYPIKWKVYNQDNEEEICCFMTTLRIVKGHKSK